MATCELLIALRISPDQRPALASFLFHLHRRLSVLPHYQALLKAARDEAVVNELKRMARFLHLEAQSA